MSNVLIFDTTLRDGEQSPGVSLGMEDKLQIARYLAALRVDVIEAGFPIASEGEQASVAAIAREMEGPIVAALARTNERDIDAAWEAIREAERPRIHVFISTSDVHLSQMLRMSREQALEAAVASIRYARRFTEDVQFSAQDATRTDLDFLVQILTAAVEAGARTINVPDTVGYATPSEYRQLFESLAARVSGLSSAVLSTHTHDDLGLATANALAAVEGGARQIECTINGIGERAGNCALEEVVMGLRTRGDAYRATTRIDSSQLSRTSRLVSGLTGMPVQPNKAVVGANAFSHEAGIHQDGMLKDRTTYEIMKPEDVGFRESTLVLGKHSGRHALRVRMKDLGYELSDDQLTEVFARFKHLADRKPHVSDRDIEAIVGTQLGGVEEIVGLDYFLVTSGNSAIPTATVRLNLCGDRPEFSACGGGPVDAIFRAIDGAMDRSHKLVDYRIEAVTDGANALGQVIVRVDVQGQVHLGRGLSTDVLEASALAYVNAINRGLQADGSTEEQQGELERLSGSDSDGS